MNSAPIAFRFASGSLTPRSFSRKRILGVHCDERHLEGVAERAHHLFSLVLPHQAVVDEHARELLPDGAMDEQRGDGGVDASGEPADHVPLPHLLADQRDLFLDDRRRRPGPLAPTDVGEEAR